MLSFAKISKKLTRKEQRLSYAKVPKGTVADRRSNHMPVWIVDFDLFIQLP